MSRRERRSLQQPRTGTPYYSSVPLDSPPRAHAYNSSQSSQVQFPIPQPQFPIPQPQYQPTTQYVGGPRPVRSPTSAARAARNRMSRRKSVPKLEEYQQPNIVTMSVAKHHVGTEYGPYSYHPATPKQTPAEINSRYSTQSEMSLHYEKVQDTPPPRATTTTVPQYIWNEGPDADDAFHAPDPRRDGAFTLFSIRGWINVGGLVSLVCALLMLFIGYPVILYTRPTVPIYGYNLGQINASGQIPILPGLPTLVDKDTPANVLTRIGTDNQLYDLVFSDEFNVDGRTFYPGDDPYWEAADLHYWATGDYEYYDPSAVTTADGKLVLTMTEEHIHDLNWKSGMLTSWNKLCFTTGYVEVSVSLPGRPDAPGLWPAVWTLGNLGRAGYGGTTQGTWPYSYDACDVGTFPNQTDKNRQPSVVWDQSLSYHPGQKLSACSCPGSDHPGPRHDVGRGVPEIDILEGEIDTNRWQGIVSQSYQIAPFDAWYLWNTSTPPSTFYNPNITRPNSYSGGHYQEACSGLTYLDNTKYGGGPDAFSTYAVEYYSNPNHRSEGYITWFSGGTPTWTLTPGSIGPNPVSNISERIISEEPMYVLMNLAMAYNFQRQDFSRLRWPVSMYIDYIRIYQRRGTKDGLTCDPPQRPTKDYIDRHMNVYTNPNITTWAEGNNTFPRNRLYDGC